MLHNSGNGSSPPETIKPLPDCANGIINSVPLYIRITAAVSCILSIFGVLVIIYTYVAFKRFRSKMREIIVHISLMDFTVAMANVIGIMVNFESLLAPYEKISFPHYIGFNQTKLYQTNTTHFHILNNLCITQAAFAIYGTICSLLWTTAFTVYCYFVIIGEDMKLAKRLSYSFYIICYGVPVIIIAWLGATKRMGYSPVGGGGWCSLIFKNAQHQDDRFTLFLGYNLWIYITFIVIVSITVAILVHLKTQLHRDVMSNQGKSTVQTIEKKLLAIPVLFLVLRIWSFLLTMLSLYDGLNSCAIVLFFLGMGAIGDSGQGLFNSIIFCLFNQRIRQSYKDSIRKCFRCKRNNEEEPLFSSGHTGLTGGGAKDTVTAVGIESTQAESNIQASSNSHELAKPYTVKWKVQSANFKASNN